MQRAVRPLRSLPSFCARSIAVASLDCKELNVERTPASLDSREVIGMTSWLHDRSRRKPEYAMSASNPGRSLHQAWRPHRPPSIRRCGCAGCTGHRDHHADCRGHAPVEACRAETQPGS
eukprot:10349649-Heterocapsa_arctica.AAC.1